MRKYTIALGVFLMGFLGFAGVAGATTPIVDAEAEATNLFNSHAPTVVNVILAVAGFTITMAVLGAAISRVRGALR